MRKTHLDPGEAIRAHRDLGAKWMMPIHYDTFINSDDTPGDCLKELHASMRRMGLPSSEVIELKVGERRVLREQAAVSARRIVNFVVPSQKRFDAESQNMGISTNRSP